LRHLFCLGVTQLKLNKLNRIVQINFLKPNPLAVQQRLGCGAVGTIRLGVNDDVHGVTAFISQPNKKYDQRIWSDGTLYLPLAVMLKSVCPFPRMMASNITWHCVIG